VSAVADGPLLQCLLLALANRGGTRSEMTPQLATRLTIHDTDVAPAFAGGGTLGAAADVVARQTGATGAVESSPVRIDRAAIYRRTLAATDMLAALVALTVVLRLMDSAPVGAEVLVFTPITVLLFKVVGLYDRDELRLTHSTLDEVPTLLQLTGLMALGSAILLPLVSTGGVTGQQLAVMWTALFIAIFTSRVLARAVAGRLTPAERCLVMGAPERAASIREKLAAGNVRAMVVATLPIAGDEMAELASVDVVRRIVRDLRLDRLIIAPSTSDGHGINEWIRVAKAVGVPVSVQPLMLDAAGSSLAFEDLEGMTMLGIKRFGLSRSSRLVKRSFDTIVTSAGMLVAGPLIAVIAVAIKLDSAGPVFYRQVRVGRDGRHFSIYKFRSMVQGAHAQRDQLRALNEAGAGLFKISDDPRVTRVGRLLRRTSLDELPQLINVLRGEMSLVGPRPLVVDEDAQVVGLDRSRLHLTPGMTGPWQILGSRVPMREMVALDYLYVANWSLWLDLKLLVRTVRHVLRGGNI